MLNFHAVPGGVVALGSPEGKIAGVVDVLLAWRVERAGLARQIKLVSGGRQLPVGQWLILMGKCAGGGGDDGSGLRDPRLSGRDVNGRADPCPCRIVERNADGYRRQPVASNDRG